ncbi:hypothetical protein [uncultured Lactobacillus sp.]|uniref:hypothetical protein n=1 Tax=Limosilactobacillus balticus TaxID=2759747 RepID=UPI00261F2EE4|nr:hypothetical protein [uncultured Lactobacillus sp.]
MDIDVILLNLLFFDFLNDKGNRIKGVSVRFIDPNDRGRDNQIGASIQKMTMSADQWDNLKAQNLQTFSKVKLTFEGFGRSMRLIKLEKIDDHD